MYFRFFVLVCLCAAVYGVIKNNNLVRLSSIVPFHIIYQVNLYRTEGITLLTNTTTLRHFFTLWLSTLTSPAVSTPAIWYRIFMSRIFSRPVHPSVCLFLCSLRTTTHFRRIWTNFGMRLPRNTRMVTKGHLQR